ncbi:cysteate synthase [Moorena producens]|uniref:cysteate synthase n=1 Tax=Moorena producens TaxID=1155739 RepID=UPI003C75D668
MKSKLKYILRCTLCGKEYEPDPFRLWCDEKHEPSLLRAVYANEKLEVKENLPGLFRYIDWLPVDRYLEADGKPITYQSKNLAHHLGLDHLFICFNGYWPERDAHLSTCSFKELEAFPILARIPEDNPKTLVVASAGNTGRAFATVCSKLKIPFCLVIPEQNLSAIWSKEPFDSSCVRLIAVGGNGDYSDAIRIGQIISQLEGFFPEGGAKNVARRDGMGLTVVDATVTIGEIPDHYFQAVGSGTGGISAYEANLRFLADGRFGNKKMKLHLCQNIPFTPMTDAWKAGKREITALSEIEAKKCISQVSAKVLTNRNPAYSLAGGVYEALADTEGEMYGVTNDESEKARALFEELEGIDVSPAAGVATGALIQAVEAGKIGKKETIVLNITSGGYKRMRQDYPLHYLKPDLVFKPEEIEPDFLEQTITTVS